MLKLIKIIPIIFSLLLIIHTTFGLFNGYYNKMFNSFFGLNLEIINTPKIFSIINSLFSIIMILDIIRYTYNRHKYVIEEENKLKSSEKILDSEI